MSEVKQVKVDNWGIYFLQRLKHFFNRTDYCDLTLQFQDNAQLKVHRLVLSACTEYFELLERTCEMYEDCLVMPDDLQADVVVPIVNFMYTGQLEFKMDLLEKLHQTSEIMSMPVLTKLLDSHRPKTHKITQMYSAPKRIPKKVLPTKPIIRSVSPTQVVTTQTVKSKHDKKPIETTTIYRDKKVYMPYNRKRNRDIAIGARTYREPSPIPLDSRHFNTKVVSGDPRPTRYELPEELDRDNIFESSFCNISYTTPPVIVHPETQKQYAKRPRLIDEPTTSKKLALSTVDIVECKRTQDALFEESIIEQPDLEAELYPQPFESCKVEPSKDTSLLFDQILEHNEEPKIAIERKSSQTIKTLDSKSVSENLDHAKIISEVLKKYPHLVKSNKNIKLKILNTPNKNSKKQKASPTLQSYVKPLIKTEKDTTDYTYETDVLDSKQAARLIALGAENVDGPWICLICGTPGKAMNFTSYYKFRRHLVEVHNEKAVLNMCEYCGQRCTKRNYLLHHLYTKHNVEPPGNYRFPKCNCCNYVALTEALLVKHKASSHSENKNFRCNVCPAAFNSSNQLLTHIQNTGHKFSSREKRSNLQCVYCQKVFMREANLCSHLKAYHRAEAIKDSIIDDSDDEPDNIVKNNQALNIKSEPSVNDFEEVDIQYQIQQRPDGNIHVVTRKTREPSPNKQKILNSSYVSQIQAPKKKVMKPLTPQTEYIEEINDVTPTHGDFVVIDNNEYILRDNQLIPRVLQPATEEYILADQNISSLTPETAVEYTNVHDSNIQESIQPNVLMKNTEDLAQPIPIYVSSEEQYKALIASNQSIIVDNTDANKMLTVLTAPHAATLETTSMDLNNTQTNDMMIIQDNYPMNVSEAVASNNSNIVVVYSHQVGDQNKQFQLLTTQGLGAQFVQTSAILTQNYETITTTAPVMNAPTVEDKEIWHNNVHQMINNNEIEITPVSNVSNMVDTNQTQITSTDQSEDHMDELPDVQLSSNVTETTVNSDDTTTSQCQAVISDTPNIVDNLSYVNENEESVPNTQVESSMEVDEETPIEEQSVNETEETNEITESVENDTLATQTEEEENNLPLQQIDSGESEHANDSQETSEMENENLVQPEEISIANPPPVLDNMNLEKIDSVISKPLISNKEPELVPEDVEEQQLAITMTSDDTDQVEENQDINNDALTNVEQGEELEESIENIQQEVEKQITGQSTEYEDAETEIEANSTQNEAEDLNNATVSSQEESDHEENTDTEKPDPAETQEKISSLLNDWEDSQEDNNSGNENGPTESAEATESATVEPEEASEPADQENHKQDNITSLVNDWDEDEEENKE